MSTKILVIPEDAKYNGYILKPIVQRVVAEAGRAKAQITILPRAKSGGIDSAKNAIRNELAPAWRWMDLWLFIPDGDRMNAAGAAEMERQLAAQNIALICCPAMPEIEAWLLAGHRARLNIEWNRVAGHPRFKEEVFEPFMREHGYPDLPGMGREKLTLETLANYAGLKHLCPEIERLEERIREHFAGRP
ncbi:MAG: hypothetical protein C5B50_22465 [Verrucomicrobia bacterium]|nr:MAG: hypothetical protein C5B50_22465 [Verrucomicrobiota bacterium]